MLRQAVRRLGSGRTPLPALWGSTEKSRGFAKNTVSAVTDDSTENDGSSMDPSTEARVRVDVCVHHQGQLIEYDC